MELQENTETNKQTIKLEEDNQQPNVLINSLWLMELEILKTYIETNLKTGFIWLFNSLIGTPILFDKKPDSSFWLCVNY